MFKFLDCKSFYCFLAVVLMHLSPTAQSFEYFSESDLLGKQKQEIHWQNVLSSTYVTLPTQSWFSLPLALLNPGFLAVAFDHQGDFMPAGRQKLLHPFGSVAKVSWRARPGHPFTGIYASGGIGLIRLSLAGDPSIIGSYTPGMAIKIFIDGHDSVNLHVMNSLDGQGSDTDFFANIFKNQIDPPRSRVLGFLAGAFAKVKNPPTELNVDHLSKINPDGSLVQNPIWMQRIYFAPTDSAHLSNRSHQDFRVELSSIPEGTVLYKIMAPAQGGGRPYYIGDLVLESSLVASAYGDQVLYFRHNR